MPELPDVEAFRHYLLSERLPGRSVTAVTLLWPRAVQTPSINVFRQNMASNHIREIGRRAKFLLFRLDGQTPQRKRTLIIHLRMTGALVVKPAGRERPRHTRNVFHLDDGRELCFADPRKLGQMWLVSDEDEVLSGLGPEPLDAGFTTEVLAQRLSPRNVPVKVLLCDQSLVAGIGNIYADKVLFASGIHPLRHGSGLSQGDVRTLHQAIRKVLANATRKLTRLMPMDGPPTESDEGLRLLLVPRVEGASCPRCATRIERLVIRGRSAYFCPHCQPS